MINKQIIYFFIYCFVGWVCEEIYCALLDKKFTNRGFLRGPYLPIYGSGAIAIIYFIYPYFPNPIAFFMLSSIVCSIIEYIGSLILEKTFHIRLWDYSKNFANIHGRICLLNSILFGILGFFVVYFIHPFLVLKIDLLSKNSINYISKIIEFIITFDFATSLMRMRSFSIAMEDIRLKSEELQHKVLSLSANSPKSLIEAKDKFERELNKQKALLAVKSSKIFSAFPNMSYKDTHANLRLELFKMELKSFIEKGRAENQVRSDKLNLMYENAKAQIKNNKNK